MPDVPVNPTVVGIDPGTTMMGVCTIEFDPKTFDIFRVSPISFNGNKLNPSEWDTLAHGERHARLVAHGINLLRYLREENPSYVACESPFYNRLRPSAYGPLKEALCEIQLACTRYSPYTTLNLVDPPTVKKAIKAAGDAKKAGMLIALGNLTELASKLDKPIEELDEHAIDAAAVAYWLFTKLKANLLSK